MTFDNSFPIPSTFLLPPFLEIREKGKRVTFISFSFSIYRNIEVVVIENQIKRENKRMLKLLKRSKENNKKAKKKRATISLIKVITVL